MKNRVVVKGLGTLLTISLLTGCWDKREINEMNFLSAVAADSGEHHPFNFTFQWFLPAMPSSGSGSAQTQPSSSSYAIEANSIKEAEKELSKISPRIPFYSHIEVIVIGNELAKKGIRELIDRFGRDVQLRRSKYLLIAAHKGGDILQATTAFEMPGTDMRAILERTNRSSEYCLVNFNDFMVHYTDPDLLSFLPIVRTVPSKGITGSRGKKAKHTLQLEGMAFFEKDRMIASIDGEQTRAWLYTQGNITKGTVVQWRGRGQETADFQTISQSRKLDIDLSSFPINVTLKIRTKGVIAEISDTLDLAQAKTLKKVETQLEAAIQRQIEQFIKKSQDEKKDMLLLGREIRSYYPKKWKELRNEWNDIYSSANFRVKVNVDIKNTGKLRKKLMKQDRK